LSFPQIIDFPELYRLIKYPEYSKVVDTLKINHAIISRVFSGNKEKDLKLLNTIKSFLQLALLTLFGLVSGQVRNGYCCQ